jgi:hypothetical protein
MRPFAVPVLLAAALSAPAVAAETGAPAFTLGVSGSVPVTCRAELDARFAAASGPLGRLEEYCNDPNGYEVYAEASPELAGASLVVDGIATPLAPGAPTLVARSAEAGMTSRAVELRLPDGRAAAGALSFRIVPL